MRGSAPNRFAVEHPPIGSRSGPRCRLRAAAACSWP